MLTEVKKARGKKNPLTIPGLKALREEYVRTLEPMRLLAGQAMKLEQQISDLVNQAYGLTPEEIDLMWKTTPPRMQVGGIRKAWLEIARDEIRMSPVLGR